MIVAPIVVLLLLAYKAYGMAAFAGGITVAVLLIRRFSPAGQKRIDHALGMFANAVGLVVGYILLAPVFFIGMTVARLMGRLSGSDPLRLRCGESPTFWLPSDYESRREQYAKSMFCTERLSKGGLSLMALSVMTVLLITAAEVGLRNLGCFAMLSFTSGTWRLGTTRNPTSACAPSWPHHYDQQSQHACPRPE
jgi:hypothetical protein